MRTDPTQLPSLKELIELLNVETKRDLSPERLYEHYFNVDVFKDFLNEIDVESSKLKTYQTWEEWFEASREITEKVLGKIKNLNKDEYQNQFDSVYDYLQEEDKLEVADLIFVFGQKLTYRAEKAIELYKKGLAPKILFSGRSPIYEDRKPEAFVFKELAIDSGIPEGDILTEENSISMLDNVTSSLNLLDKLGQKYERLILVNSNFSQRRGYGLMQKFTDSNVKLFRCNSFIQKEYSKDEWYKNEIGTKIIINEFIKMWGCLQNNTI